MQITPENVLFRAFFLAIRLPGINDFKYYSIPAGSLGDFWAAGVVEP
jgi:hypothetical protein